jgi:hypothetical protein
LVGVVFRVDAVDPLVEFAEDGAGLGFVGVASEDGGFVVGAPVAEVGFEAGSGGV